MGIPSSQDLIPSALATNLSVLLLSLGRKHDGEGGPAKSYLSVICAALVAPVYSRAAAMPITPARKQPGGNSDLMPPCHPSHHEPDPGVGAVAMLIE